MLEAVALANHLQLHKITVRTNWSVVVSELAKWLHSILYAGKFKGTIAW
jgi:hypothetical protein